MEGVSNFKTMTLRHPYLDEEVKAHLIYADELGSVGTMRCLMDRVGVDDGQLVVAGDNFVRHIDSAEMVGFHRKVGAMVTLVLYQLKESLLIEHCSGALLSRERRIVRFRDKPLPTLNIHARIHPSAREHFR